jgi:hypothetical protein
MPNWCDNVVRFTHTDPVQIRLLAEAWNNGALMQAFVPCPEDVKNTPSAHYPDNTPEKFAQEHREKINTKLYGHANWYDWQIANWGTKWDVGRRAHDSKITVKNTDKNLTLNFQSAWSPPVEFYKKMAALGFGVSATYCEFGVGYVGEFKDGVDTEWSLEGFDNTAQWLEDRIPDKICEDFNLYEQLCHEEENE